MTSEDVDEWLDSWVEAHYQNWDTPENAAKACLAEAASAGISERDLNAAASGDLAAYLQEEAAAIAEASDEAPADF
ncbi:hypothetical protein [Asaia astilbis]|uniref:hypothetical protein n=1 Tax=Asaia astilbis TaxID=610244 RepID=UPI000472C051|nr:hypothetical protein [Asaia astilbis]